MIFARKRQIVSIEEPLPKPICGHILYDKPEYSTQNLLTRVVIATGLFFALLFTSILSNFVVFFYLFAFLLLGAEVIARAIIAIKERYIDENLLILILSLCAFYANKYAHALLLLLFYSYARLLQNYCINISREKFYALLPENLIKDSKEFIEIHHDIHDASRQKVPNMASIRKFSFYMALILLAITSFYALYAYNSLERGIYSTVDTSITLLLASTPFALFFAIPFNSAMAIFSATKKDISIKGANYLYALDTVNLLLLDSVDYLTEELVEAGKIIGFRIVVLSTDEKGKERADELGVELKLTDAKSYMQDYEEIRSRSSVRKLAFVGSKEEFAPLSARAEVSICYYNENTPLLCQASDIVFLKENRIETLFLRSAKAKSINRANIILGIVYKLWAVTMAVYGLFTPMQVIYFDFFLVLITVLNSLRQLRQVQ